MSARAKVVIAVSQDFGELANAVQFGAAADIDATLLLPAKLATANRGELPLPAMPYAGLDDVAAAVERERPDLVCLFSAYLFGVNGLITAEGLRALIDHLRGRGVAIATTDPFLGLLQSQGAAVFSEHHPARAMLERHFAQVAALLAGVPHLYPVPPVPPPPVPWASFYNPAMVAPVSRSTSTWLFVLAQEDYGAQAGRLGRAAFEIALADRLGDAVDAGRSPVLVAPEPCVRALAAAGRLPREARLVPFCGHAQFRELLLGAEYVFYWNVFTNSAAMRLANARPMFLFDIGHMAHALPPLLERGLRTYFPGVALPMLDLRVPLDAAALAAHAAKLLGSLDGARVRLQSQPTPAQAAARLLQGGS